MCTLGQVLHYYNGSQLTFYIPFRKKIIQSPVLFNKIVILEVAFCMFEII